MLHMLEKVLIGRIIVRLWRLMAFLLLPFIWVGIKVYQYCRMVVRLTVTNTISFAQDHWDRLWRYKSADSVEDLGQNLAQDIDDPWKRIPLSVASLILGVPLMVVMTLAIGFGIWVTMAIVIDQVTYPAHELSAEFSADGPNATAILTPAQKAVIVTDAIIYQLDQEMHHNTWGWTPNDLAGYGPLAWPRLFDNRVNRQLGVIFATREILTLWSVQTSKLGTGGRESVDLVSARQEGFAVAATSWFLPAAENSYGLGIEHVREYQRRLLAGSPEAVTNVRKDNLARIILALKDDVLAEPYGQLIDRTATVSWFKIDDAVFRAQGTAIVARDVLAAISIAYRDELRVAQASDNITKAIESLDAATHFNPWWVTQGEGDSMVADSRSKVGRYLSEAIRRLEDISTALGN